MSDSSPWLVGRQIGGYRIVERIGGGGMGEVYRAKDTRLGREVAIKILPRERAGDPEREGRFLREAQAASALNHPNILAVYDVGTDDGTTFIVSELVDGAVLTEKMQRGALPIKELLSYAAQTADGLAAAHQARIVHRDLKPDNIIVSRDGRVKIIDFGVAKSSAVSESLREADAAARTDTEAGQILGTVPYMSPEQARGVVVDYHADQFSFGVILYELATGLHPFKRDAPVQTLAAIIDDEPAPVREINPKIPSPLEWIIERCLAKDPQRRYASTVDLAHDLAALRDRQWPSAAMVADGQARRGIRGLPLVVAAAAIAVGTGVVMGLVVAPRLFPAIDAATYRFRPIAAEPGFQSGPALDPEGKTLAYIAEVNGVTQVFVRRLGDAGAPVKPIFSKPFDCWDLFWSSDGAWLYFIAQAGYTTGLFRVSAVGGVPLPVIEDATTAAISRNGKALAFLRNADSTQAGQNSGQLTLWVGSEPDPDGTAKRYERPPFDKSVAAGTLRFSPDGTTLAAWVQPWSQPDPGLGPRLYLIPMTGSGDPQLVPLPDQSAGTVQFSWMPDGRHIVAALNEFEAGTHLSLIDVVHGSVRRLTAGTERENFPSLSASDPGKIAFVQERAHFDVIEIAAGSKAPVTLIGTSLSESDPIWSPVDGARTFAYVTDRNGRREILRRSYDGGTSDELLVRDDSFSDRTSFLGDPVFSPEGLRMAYTRARGRPYGWRIWLSTIGGAAPQPLITGNDGAYPLGLVHDFPTWSPQEDWIAFNETEGEGVRRLMKVQVGSGQPPQVVRQNIAHFPCPWSPNGRLLACQTNEGLILISPDGVTEKTIAKRWLLAYDWDRPTGGAINGLRAGADGRTLQLLSIDVRTGAERILNGNVGTLPRVGGPVRGFSQTSHGTFLTSIAVLKSEVYLMEGVQLPGPFAEWLAGLLGRRP